jgi:hypothetical protein
MTALGLRHAFACNSCGNPSIRLPDTIDDAAELHCAGCGIGLGSWASFKERTRQVILREIERGAVTADRASRDLLRHALDSSSRCLQKPHGSDAIAAIQHGRQSDPTTHDDLTKPCRPQGCNRRSPIGVRGDTP